MRLDLAYVIGLIIFIFFCYLATYRTIERFTRKGQEEFIKTEYDKFKICTDDSKSYRKDNVAYDLKTIGSPILSTEKEIFLKRLYKGKANLYAYKILRSDVGTVKPKTFYIIEKNNKLHLISNSNSKQDLVDLFIDNSKLSDLIFNDFYTIENIYLIVKAYDLYQ